MLYSKTLYYVYQQIVFHPLHLWKYVRAKIVGLSNSWKYIHAKSAKISLTKISSRKN